jgi:hypothetical protein
MKTNNMETENKEQNGGGIIYTIISIAGACYGIYILLTI